MPSPAGVWLLGQGTSCSGSGGQAVCRAAHCLVAGHLAWGPSLTAISSPVPTAWLLKAVGPASLCRAWNEMFVRLCCGVRDLGVGTGIAQQPYLLSKINNPASVLTLLPYPLHNAPVCPSHVIFIFLSAILFARCCFFSHMLIFAGYFTLAEMLSSFHLT